MGTEFIQRLDMNWSDLVQIVLFNLTTENQQTFFHIDKVLMRYLNDMKNALQISDQVSAELPKYCNTFDLFSDEV